MAKVKVRNKLTGKVGMVSEEYLSSGKYEVIGGESSPTATDSKKDYGLASPTNIGALLGGAIGKFGGNLALPGIGGTPAGTVGAGIGAGIGKTIEEPTAENILSLLSISPGPEFIDKAYRLVKGLPDSPARQEINKKAGIAQGAQTLLQPHKVVGEIRDLFANVGKAGKAVFSGDDIIELLRKAQSSKGGTGMTSYFQDEFLPQAKTAYGGKTFNLPDLLNKRMGATDLQYGSAGQPLSRLLSLASGQEADVLRNLIHQTSPGVAAADKLFQLLYGAGKVGRPLTQAASGAVGTGIGFGLAGGFQ